jgi:hypothetical protein
MVVLLKLSKISACFTIRTHSKARWCVISPGPPGMHRRQVCRRAFLACCNAAGLLSFSAVALAGDGGFQGAVDQRRNLTQFYYTPAGALTHAAASRKAVQIG